MSLFLVKWDDGSSALVGADDEDNLIDTLDQLGDPGAASWQEYDGPLWLEFPRIDHGLPDGDVAPEELGLGPSEVPITDDGQAFEEAVLAALHPNVAALRHAALVEDRAIPRAEFERALATDLVCALPGSVHGVDEGPEH